MNRTPAFLLQVMTAVVTPLVLFQMIGCNPYAPLIGTSFSRIDEYKRSQTDRVAVILDGRTFYGVRSLHLVRQKTDGQVEGHSVHVSTMFSESIQLGAITFDGGNERIRLLGSSSLADVDARSHGVVYTMFAVYPIRPEDIRRLAAFESVLVTVSGDIDIGPIEIGPRGLRAIDTYRETFVDADGIGSNVTRSSIRKSD